MNENRIAIAFMELWALQHGFQPCADWDEQDQNCLRDYGEHRVWEITAFVPSEIDLNALWIEFAAFVQAYNDLPGVSLKFQPYQLHCYSSCGRDTALYLSIYQ